MRRAPAISVVPRPPEADIRAMLDDMRAHCERCATEVDASYRTPRARRYARGYPLLIVPFLPVLPIIAADYVVMLPMLMVYMLGLGPVLAILRDPPLCDDCGAIVKAMPKAVPSPVRT